MFAKFAKLHSNAFLDKRNTEIVKLPHNIINASFFAPYMKFSIWHDSSQVPSMIVGKLEVFDNILFAPSATLLNPYVKRELVIDRVVLIALNRSLIQELSKKGFIGRRRIENGRQFSHHKMNGGLLNHLGRQRIVVSILLYIPTKEVVFRSDTFRLLSIAVTDKLINDGYWVMGRNIYCIACCNTLNAIHKAKRDNRQIVERRDDFGVWMLRSKLHILENQVDVRSKLGEDVTRSGRSRIQDVAKITITFKERQIVGEVSSHRG